MTTDEILKELAALENACEDTDCHDGYIETRPHVTTPLECPTCKGTGNVPAFPMLRIKCKPFLPPCPHIENECPGWRTRTLDEARLCLEELLIAEGVSLNYVKWPDKSYWWSGRQGQAWQEGNTPTEAVLAALYEASKVTTDA